MFLKFIEKLASLFAQPFQYLCHFGNIQIAYL